MTSDVSPKKFQRAVSRHVDTLARSVLTSLRTYPSPDLRAKLSLAASDLASLSISSGIFDAEAIMEDLKGRKFSNADIMDYCIPEAALLVGQGWIEDQVSFWQVSLSGARLFNLVKRISAEWSHSTRSDQRFAVLLVVCREQTHILGPVLLADQLRRANCSVTLVTAETGAELSSRINQGFYDLVVFSCSSLEVLETATHLVKHIRQEACVVPPLVLGGPVIDHAENIRETTGVDLVTRDIKRALSLCNRAVTPMELKVAE